jgi:hypothetical protein
MSIIDEILDEIVPLSPVEILQQKIDSLSRNIYKSQKSFLDRKKTLMQQFQEISQFASDLNVGKLQLRRMISQSFAEVGISESYLRKILPESLKFMKHTRKDYVQKQHQQDQSIYLQQSYQQDSVELPSSGQLALPSDSGIDLQTTRTHDSVVLHTEGEQVASEDKDTIIKNLKKVIKGLEDLTESFIAIGTFRYENNDILLKIPVNVKDKSIGTIEIARAVSQKG